MQLSEETNNSYYPLVRRAVRTVLTRHATEALPGTYERIYSACRSIVCVSNKGEGLYGTLRFELEQCVGHLATELTQKAEDTMEWMNLLVKICQWYDKQVVRS